MSDTQETCESVKSTGNGKEKKKGLQTPRCLDARDQRKQEERRACVFSV